MRPGADELAWVPPSEAALLALARGGAAAWPVVRRDPGAVLLLLRNSSLSFSPVDLIESAEIVESLLGFIHSQNQISFLDWSDPRRAPVLTACLACAVEAYHLATRLGTVDADRAWTAGLLASLGAIAVAANSDTQTCSDDAELTRRLARRWALPDWLSTVIGHLGLPPDVAVQLGAERDLFALTQLAVGRVQQRGEGLDVTLGATPAELQRLLHLPPKIDAAIAELPTPPTSLSLTEFLTLEAEKRRLRASGAVRRLEDEFDQLHRVLEEQRGREEERLRQSKLNALAEFAAGAGHEINNPLAVISGLAQQLLPHEPEPARRASLEKIIAQTQRITVLLRDLMQFARPAPPVVRRVDLVRIIDEIVTSLSELGQRHQVRLQFREDGPTAPTPCAVDVDEKQLRIALTCLTRNAIEAAGVEGWVRFRLRYESGRVCVVIEDSGPGLTEAHREHLFDPFYSGRSAGRGPGLGLPTAWSLARQQGGEVVLTSQPGETTQFVLRLPLPSETNESLAG